MGPESKKLAKGHDRYDVKGSKNITKRPTVPIDFNSFDEACPFGFLLLLLSRYCCFDKVEA